MHSHTWTAALLAESETAEQRARERERKGAARERDREQQVARTRGCQLAAERGRERFKAAAPLR